MCIFLLSYHLRLFCRADPVSGGSGDLNSIGTDRALNTGIIERFCFLMLSFKPAAHAVNTDAPMRLRGFSGR
ncbi:hypothetical protein PSK36_00235 [Escherichia coli]|nr:hypothetical protein [Escherichia coli]